MRYLVATMVLLTLYSCNLQEKDKQPGEAEKDTATALVPKIRSKVQKEFDEFGNLIKYDSIYSWSYSNLEGDSLAVNLDSIMDEFRRHFREFAPFEWNEGFFYFPKTDSLFMKDFFSEDYFLDRWSREPKHLEEMLKKMDSSRNAFLRKHFPGLMDSAQKK